MSAGSRASGMSLPELLVATTLFAVASAGALAVCLRAASHYRVASQAQRLQERAQYVFATLEPDLQMAGFAGPGGPLTTLPPALAEPLLRCGPHFALPADRAVEVSDRYTLTCPAQGGGAMPGSGTLTLRRLSVQRALSDAGRVQWLARTAPPQGAWLTGGSAAGTVPMAPSSTELRNLVVRYFYVSRQADGDVASPALRVKSLSSVAGVPAWIDTEVMPGVAGLLAETDPSSGPARAVRVTLQMQAESRPPGAAASPRTFTRHFAVRNVPAAE